MKKLKVAVVGCGRASIQHLRSYQRFDNVELRAVCDISKAAAQVMAQRYGIPNIYTNLPQLISKEHLDIVSICTPPMTHSALSVEALEHGCNVLVEKPMATSVKEADEMISASRNSCGKLCVVHNYLFEPSLTKGERLVKQGAIGKCTMIMNKNKVPSSYTIAYKNSWEYNLAGGVFEDLVPHSVYVPLHFFKNLNSVEVFARKVLKQHLWPPFGEYVVVLDFEDGMSIAQISFTFAGSENKVEFSGTNGSLEADLLANTCITNKAKKRLYDYLTGNSLEALSKGVETARGFLDVVLRQRSGHFLLIQQWVNSIVLDGNPPVDGEDGRSVVAICELLVKRLLGKYKI